MTGFFCIFTRSGLFQTPVIDRQMMQSEGIYLKCKAVAKAGVKNHQIYNNL
jgi:hypothetical protein